VEHSFLLTFIRGKYETVPAVGYLTDFSHIFCCGNNDFISSFSELIFISKSLKKCKKSNKKSDIFILS